MTHNVLSLDLTTRTLFCGRRSREVSEGKPRVLPGAECETVERHLHNSFNLVSTRRCGEHAEGVVQDRDKRLVEERKHTVEVHLTDGITVLFVERHQLAYLKSARQHESFKRTRPCRGRQ